MAGNNDWDAGYNRSRGNSEQHGASHAGAGDQGDGDRWSAWSSGWNWKESAHSNNDHDHKGSRDAWRDNDQRGGQSAVAAGGAQVLHGDGTEVETDIGSSGDWRVVAGIGVYLTAAGACVVPASQTAVADTNASADMLALANVGFDLEYFRSLPTPNGYKQHNVALKYFRDTSEVDGLEAFVFNNTEPNPVPPIVHEKGTNYHFEEPANIPWSWQEMVAKMDEQSMEMVMHGLLPAEQHSFRSRGRLVGCRLQKTDRYDHKRHHALGVGKTSDMLFI